MSQIQRFYYFLMALFTLVGVFCVIHGLYSHNWGETVGSSVAIFFFVLSVGILAYGEGTGPLFFWHRRK